MSRRSFLNMVMARIQQLDPGHDYDVALIVPSILSELDRDDLWIAEHLSEIHIGIAQRLEEDLGLDNGTALAPKWHFYLDPTGRELRSRRRDNPDVYDAVQEKLSWLNSLKSIPTLNAEVFEIACREALAKALPSAVISHTRLHTDKGIDVYGTIPLESRLGSIYLLCQVKLQDIEGGKEIRTFYGATQYLLHARLRHHLTRAPEDLRDFLLRMPTAPPVVLVFCAVSYSSDAEDECRTLGVRPLDFRWIATQLARGATRD